MEILYTELIPVKIKLKVPSLVAYGGSDEETNIVVKITATDGKTGWGNSAPDPNVTGENMESLETVIRSGIIQEHLHGSDVVCIKDIEHALLRLLPEMPSLRAGVSIALWDLLGKELGVPLVRLLGQARRSIETSITIPLLQLDEIAPLAREYKKQGFRIPKVKLGGNMKEDLERIKRVRAVFGEDCALRLDANQSYAAEGALLLLKSLEEENVPVEFLEQPTPADHLYSLKQVTDVSSDVPIMADESVLGCSDIMLVAEMQAADLINIKLMKSGGIEAACRSNHVAQCAGLPTMMGCMDESLISIAAGLAVCLSNVNFKYADLDGHIEVQNDVATGGVVIENGIMYPSEEPGLGVQVKI